MLAIGSNRRHRLSAKAAFGRVIREGFRLHAQHLQLLAMPAAGPVGRVGFVIGKAQLGRAVDRNYARRVLREAVRKRRPEVDRFDVVLRVRGRCEQDALRGLSVEAGALLDALLLSKTR